MIDKFWSLVGVIFFVSILPIMYFSTMSSGDDVISVLAVKHGVCKRLIHVAIRRNRSWLNASWKIQNIRFYDKYNDV